VENGLATVRVGDVLLTAVAPREPAGHVSVCIRGEDVILQTSSGREASSPRNRLDAAVCGWQKEGALVRIQLDCGFPMTALVTRPAWEELKLVEGSRVLALVKAPAIHLIARDS
jgi:molybdate transport system ATP-binding protein